MAKKSLLKKCVLLCERLEDRLTPSWGVVWPNASHLTLSFVPDGTNVAGKSSNLFQTMNAIAPTSVWEAAVLRAVQSWAKNANINVGVVPDNGSPLGVAGSPQGDSRFGDIRIAAVQGTADVEATASPFDWSGSTWGGDVVLNSQSSFGVGSGGAFDLYTVVAHEVGHVFGFQDNTDPTSLEYRATRNPRRSRRGRHCQSAGAL